MRELEPRAAEPQSALPGDHPRSAGAHPAGAGGPLPESVGIVGRGRAGRALGRALRDAGLTVHGPWGRGEVPPPADAREPIAEAVLLCVPDAQIGSAARAVAGAAPLVGHTSGATPLSALAPASRAGAAVFGLHPLQTLTGEEAVPASRLLGAACAVAGSTPTAVRIARGLAERLGLVPFEITDEDRPAYHAAASIASNFLVTLEDAAEVMACGAGMSADDARRALAPLVRATVESWAALGPERALTGPVARGDEPTVSLQRLAVARTEPALLPLFDALVDRTRALAARGPAREGPAGRAALARGGAR